MSEALIPEDKYKLSNEQALSWCAAELCFAIVFLGMILWGVGLKDYVDDQLQREVSTSLTFLLTITMAIAGRETISVLIIIAKNFHYQVHVLPKERERQWEEERKQRQAEWLARHAEESKKKQERQRKKNMKPIGEPIDLKQWVGGRSYWRGGYIYILKDTEISGYYKIGKTKQPFERMKAFGVQLPFAVELIHVIKCHSADEVERRLHRQFASKRQRGEWFSLNDEDVAAIKLVHEIAA